MISSALCGLIGTASYEPANYERAAVFTLLRGFFLGGMIGVGFWFATVYTMWLLTFVPDPPVVATLP